MIVCVGIGPGNLEYLTRRGEALIREAEVVAGFGTVVDLVRPLIAAGTTVIPMDYRDQSARLEEMAALHRQGRRCVVVFMGDIHFSGFQLLERVERAAGGAVETVPGISSAQVLASRARVCFDETTLLTFHRRGDIEPFKAHLLGALEGGRNVIAIPRPWDFMPRDMAAYLLAAGRPAHQTVEVWENLTGSEAGWSGSLSACAERDFSDLSIVLFRSLTPLPSGLEGAL
ncbi:precorrin-6Y C5,15-methyltransferase (decarboxylating)/cobalt-precorrin-7 (C5)-methyltransferase [Deinobacterium chartae]|uniref:Precorrin-6Y C5,15-methyltransferase (Decarboxylating)/cobalt-precorrin-7 (C5)-methyltransferase n=1 Tax=Deinobacterium chartae TaxID=521158 RepID=A0A841I1Z4_9DEIO|nr:cobalt-precorrin-7 (C(5))-methyltransferase [Deinobacterium chartae]MBB6098440.1 precorrin-6Y C5,15-methyltransferase (decarboxylating)/cobalt-precorrin-7 (C5)-methyltransferase [Deinobacterium chartae]